MTFLWDIKHYDQAVLLFRSSHDWLHALSSSLADVLSSKDKNDIEEALAHRLLCLLPTSWTRTSKLLAVSARPVLGEMELLQPGWVKEQLLDWAVQSCDDELSRKSVFRWLEHVK